MLRKLIFSVLVLSLMLAFTSTAFAGTRVPDQAGLKSKLVHPIKTNKDRVEKFAGNTQTQFAKTADIVEQGVDYPYPSPYAPDHECQVLDIADYAGSWAGFYAYSETDGLEFSNRFEVQAAHNAVVYGAAVRIYELTANAGDLTFHVYDDAGGIPGAELYTETIPAAVLLANGPGHWIFPFSTSVSIPGASYHISYEAGNWVDPDPSTGDYIVFGINKTADGVCHGQSLFYDNIADGWFPLGDYMGGTWSCSNLRLSADVCYVYNDCYWDGGPDFQYILPIPLEGMTDGSMTGYGQRFEAINDTLKTVSIILYIRTDDQRYVGTNETNGMTIHVWGDDGSGNPDLGAGPLATRSVAGGVANMFPVTIESRDGPNGNWLEYHDLDVSAENLVFRGNYHVTMSMTSPLQVDGRIWALVGDYGAGGVISYDSDDLTYESTETNFSWLNEIWGNGAAFFMQAELCRDEYQECQHQVLHAGGFASAFGMGGNVWTVAQQVKARNDNRVEKLRLQVSDEQPWGGAPEDNEGTVPGNPDLRVMVWNETIDVYGDKVPGAILWDQLIPGIDVVIWPGWMEVVIPDVLTFGDFWVGYELVTTDTVYNGLPHGSSNEWYNTNMDMGPFDVNSGAWLLYEPWQEWISTKLFGIAVNNWLMAVDFCSIEQKAWPCGVADWGTLQGNYMRQGHATVGVGAAQCELTLAWSYAHPTGKFGQYTGPIIYANTIVATFRANSGTEYRTFDLITRVQGDSLLMDANVQGMPTVHYIDVLGIDVMFVSGGSSDQIVVAYDFANIGAGPIYTIGTTNALGTALGMSSAETNPFANFIISNIDDGEGADDVLFFSTNGGKVYGVDAATGAPYWLTAFTPTGFGSVSNRTGTADATGENLFYGYAAVVGGDIISLDAYTGAINWQLSDDGLKGNDAYDGGVTIEQFQAGMAYDHNDGLLYAVSSCAGAAPRAGCLYQIDGVSGLTVNDVQPVNGMNNTVTPIIDISNVILPTRAVWFRGPNDPFSVQAYRKSDLTFSWGVGYAANSSADYAVAEMVMTCEIDANDYIFFMSRNGVLHCIDGNAGVELYQRKITDQDFGGGGGALALDTEGFAHLVFQDASSGLYDFMAGASRARLELLRGNGAEAAGRGEVPFGSDPNYVVTFVDVFKNTGCEDLDVTMTLGLASNGGPDIPYFRAISGEFGQDAEALAASMTDAKFSMADNRIESPINDENTVRNTFSKEVNSNPAALALGFINNEVILATVGGMSDNQDVDVEVDQPAVGRGVFPRFVTFASNDPDYWIDDAILGGAPLPECMFTFLGGCIMEFTALPFGVDQLNEQVVFNSGRVVENSVGDFTIDGASGMLFQGMYIFGVSDRALSFTIVSWLEGSGETSTWNGWLPELIEGQCVPILDPAVSMGSWSDGVGGSGTITGNQVRYASIDSVQDFTDSNEVDGWNHANFIAPFSNTLTMGLTIQHKVVGAYDFGGAAGILGDIGNATIEIFDITERNGNAVPDWKFGCYYDWDVGSNDTTNVRRGASLAWTYDARDAGSAVGGSVKIPFNYCSNTADANYLAPLKNGITMDQAQGMWGTLGGGGNDVWYLDSMYFYASLDSAEYTQGDYVDQDQAGAYTLAEHDFEPGGSYKFAVANFQFQDYGGNNRNPARMEALAHTLNKWMGFGRGDVNNDNVIDMMDIIQTSNFVGGDATAAPIPFDYLGDVDANGFTDLADVTAIANYYFGSGDCFTGEWTM